MTRTSTEHLMVDALVERLGLLPEEITLTARFREDLGLDSLDMVELITVMEDHLGESLSDDEELESLATLADVLAYLEGRDPSATEAGR